MSIFPAFHGRKNVTKNKCQIFVKLEKNPQKWEVPNLPLKQINLLGNSRSRIFRGFFRHQKSGVSRQLLVSKKTTLKHSLCPNVQNASPRRPFGVHSLKVTANAPENRPGPKRKASSSNHFQGARH